MTTVILVGHGGYGSAMLRNLTMLVGDQPSFHTVDFNESDDLNILQEKLNSAITAIGEDADILFCCDLTGGSPFREAAARCLDHPNRATVAGLNTAAYADMTFNLDAAPSDLADMGMDVAKQSIMAFPPKDC